MELSIYIYIPGAGRYSMSTEYRKGGISGKTSTKRAEFSRDTVLVRANWANKECFRETEKRSKGKFRNFAHLAAR